VRSGSRITVALLLATALAAPAIAELRGIRVVGTAPIPAGDSPAGEAGGGAPRERALEKAIWDAVTRVALELSPDLAPGGAPIELDEVLGDDPSRYVARFRIVEDRGARPALFAEDPQIQSEYVVVAEVQVDADRLRSHLEETGRLAPPAGGPSPDRTRLVLEGVDHYPDYTAVRLALLQAGPVRSAVPISIERGRVVLELDTDRRPEDFLPAWQSAIPKGLRLIPMGRRQGVPVFRIESSAPGALAPVGPGGHAPIDTPGRNRY